MLKSATACSAFIARASESAAFPSTSFVAIDFRSDDIAVTVGQTLAIVLRRVAGSGGNDVLMLAEQGTAEDYPGGTGCQRIGGSGTGWTAHTGDFYFRTRVSP